jgi:hypothetical protein
MEKNFKKVNKRRSVAETKIIALKCLVRKENNGNRSIETLRVKLMKNRRDYKKLEDTLQEIQKKNDSDKIFMSKLEDGLKRSDNDENYFQGSFEQGFRKKINQL